MLKDIEAGSLVTLDSNFDDFHFLPRKMKNEPRWDYYDGNETLKTGRVYLVLERLDGVAAEDTWCLLLSPTKQTGWMSTVWLQLA